MNVKICVGTTCHLMGASTLIESLELLENDLKSKIVIEYAACFSACQGNFTPPVVKINDEFFGNMTPESLRKLIIDKVVEGAGKWEILYLMKQWNLEDKLWLN